MSERRWNPAPIIAVALLILPSLYVGSYLALVIPKGKTVFVPANGTPYLRIDHYRVGNETWLPRLFWPLEQIDRKVRPGAWKRGWQGFQLDVF
jgi:hypothetical protein